MHHRAMQQSQFHHVRLVLHLQRRDLFLQLSQSDFLHLSESLHITLALRSKHRDIPSLQQADSLRLNQSLEIFDHRDEGTIPSVTSKTEIFLHLHDTLRHHHHRVGVSLRCFRM